MYGCHGTSEHWFAYALCLMSLPHATDFRAVVFTAPPVASVRAKQKACGSSVLPKEIMNGLAFDSSCCRDNLALQVLPLAFRPSNCGFKS